jgi:hypothetical protein
MVAPWSHRRPAQKKTYEGTSAQPIRFYAMLTAHNSVGDLSEERYALGAQKEGDSTAEAW